MKFFFSSVIFVGLFLTPASPALAICCGCTGDDTAKTICIQTDMSACGSLSVESKNEAVKKLKCKDPVTICKTVAEGGTCTEGVFKEELYGQSTRPEDVSKKYTVRPPQLGIKIPGLEFSNVISEAGGKLQIPFLAQYVTAVYKFMIGLSMIAAAIMIVYGGFLYIFAQTGIQVRNGKTVIIDAVIGLIIVVSGHMIVTTINPALVAFKALELDTITPSDQDFLNAYGTSLGDVSNEVASKINIPYGLNPPPDEDIALSDQVSISRIKIDKALGGPGNLHKFCASLQEIKKAVTPEDKRKLLARAVLGYHKVCTVNGLCAYCQACSTAIPKGGVDGTKVSIQYAVKHLLEQGVETAETIYPNNPKCRDILNKTGEFAKERNPMTKLATTPECATQHVPFYVKHYADNMTKGKLWGGDCVSTVWSILSCAGVSKDAKIQVEQKDSKGNKEITNVFDDKHLSDYAANPRVIVASLMSADVLAEAEKKGGLRFGDLIYTVGASGGDYSLHWLMYTGGRPDVPFSFIEMGGDNNVSIKVPDLPKAVSGVGVKPKNWSLADYVLSKTRPRPGYYKKKNGEPLSWAPPLNDPNKTYIYVWRSIPDAATGASGAISPATP